MCSNAFNKGDAVKISSQTVSFRQGFAYGTALSVSSSGIIRVRCGKNSRRVRPFYRGHLERVEIRKGHKPCAG